MILVNEVLPELHLPLNQRILRISKSDLEKILNHARKDFPNEACGLLSGVIEDGISIVKEVYLLKNVDESNDHFTMDPKEQLAAVKDSRQKGNLLLGNWHSHPESPSRPSEEDKKLAYDSKAIYAIVSLMEPQEPVLNAFSIVNHTEVTVYDIEITE